MAPTNILRAGSTKPAVTRRANARTQGEPRIAVLRLGRVVIRVRLKATPTADRIWQTMPLYGTAELWGTGAVHFETHVETGREADARTNVRAGEIAYWIEGDRIMIGFAATPLSKAGEIRLPAPVNVWGEALDAVGVLASVQPGERASLLHADS